MFVIKFQYKIPELFIVVCRFAYERIFHLRFGRYVAVDEERKLRDGFGKVFENPTKSGRCDRCGSRATVLQDAQTAKEQFSI